MKRIEMVVRDALLRIGEGEQAAGEIGPGVPLEFERHRVGTALDPYFAAHDSLHAVIDLAAYYTVMNSKGHGKNGRGGEIRTHDLLYPKQARYQATLRPEPR